MKSYVAVTLIVVGGLIILGPLYSIERNKDRIAEFYSRNGSAVVLPDAMQTKNTLYEWVCLAIGLGMVATGVNCVRTA